MGSMNKQREVIGVGGRDIRSLSTLQRLMRVVTRPDRILSYLRRKGGYQQAWEHLASDTKSAYAMVDSSKDEVELRRRGEKVAGLLAEALCLNGKQRVLEIGCGPARIGRELAKSCASWVGVDISKRMIARAKIRTSHLVNVELYPIEGAQLSQFKDASFDRIYCHSVLVHIDKEDLFKYLCEISRLLAPDSIAYFDTWNLLHPESWRWFHDSMKGSPLQGRKESWRPQFATAPEFHHFIERAGLQEILMIDESHLLQAWAGRLSSNENSKEWIRRWRSLIEIPAKNAVGLD